MVLIIKKQTNKQSILIVLVMMPLGAKVRVTFLKTDFGKFWMSINMKPSLNDDISTYSVFLFKMSVKVIKILEKFYEKLEGRY